MPFPLADTGRRTRRRGRVLRPAPAAREATAPSAAQPPRTPARTGPANRGGSASRPAAARAEPAPARPHERGPEFLPGGAGGDRRMCARRRPGNCAGRYQSDHSHGHMACAATVTLPRGVRPTFGRVSNAAQTPLRDGRRARLLDLVERVQHDPADSGGARGLPVLGGFHVAVEQNPLGRHSRRERASQLPGRADVERQTLAVQPPEHRATLAKAISASGSAARNSRARRRTSFSSSSWHGVPNRAASWVIATPANNRSPPAANPVSAGQSARGGAGRTRGPDTRRIVLAGILTRRVTTVIPRRELPTALPPGTVHAMRRYHVSTLSTMEEK